ncbi:isocitrate lyase/phosphoenolpyruvate mutase family protein [Marinicella sp. S1101]|uniref:isocitrate lyase/PEP mutase family protein n=1 Tax=Marinicella marina TaxID=2996016 RepID=UPI002260EF8F|nr:isocitrate lyase/phosphoenolpyruvate mutase family protein [Marinicella marina]MCX7552550.1 isocitrate lyase/phosphoenolpyruvate mutase family protein [Marinicella marina]MDJ1139426.1 isocitrate lyase/phosphoenolpyruvate mutase family protein [Marinicella marina]
MTQQYKPSFKQLHQQQKPLRLTNIWDSASAAIVQQAGAQAHATSSAALAWANGYADDGSLPRQVLLAAIERIMRITNIPLSVDIEDGYTKNPADVASLVQQLAALGVAGINIEDGVDEPKLLVDKIKAIKTTVTDTDFFINARTDVLLRSLHFKHTQTAEIKSRAQLYQTAGADGIFIPGLEDEQTIQHLTQAIKLPVNIMTESAEKNLEALTKAGVKRISLGPNPFIQAYTALTAPHSATLDYARLNQLLS